MHAATAIDLFPFASSQTATRTAMPIKSSVILIRWPVVIICSYLLLYRSVQFVPNALLNVFILFYIGSNVGLYFVDEARFASASFYSPLVVADTLVLTLSLIINGHVATDFYLTYFLLIIICCIFENPKVLAIISVLAPVVYAVLLLRFAGTLDPSVFLRLPFLFIISLFYGYFTQLVRAEKASKKEAEYRKQGAQVALDILSHEFRTPLNLIGGYAQALKDNVFGPLNSEQQQALTKMLRQSDNLLHMVNTILDLARVEAGDLSVQREDLPVSDFLGEMKMNCDVPPDKPVSLKWSIDPELPTLQTDKAKLAIILQNLINNAVKFTDQGQVHISARLTADQKRVEFEIADSGTGIPKESIPFIFDKFRQVDSASTRSYGGAGLGLHVVKVFTELLGGTITVESEVEKGSTFRLSLPVPASELK
jgi:signal transduction histidine kinase